MVFAETRVLIAVRQLDRSNQLGLSVFFIGLLSELWMGQNEFYVNASTLEPTVVGSFEAPAADLLQLISMVEKHILRMNIRSTCESFISGSGGFYDDLSLYQPLDAIRRYIHQYIITLSLTFIGKHTSVSERHFTDYCTYCSNLMWWISTYDW